MDGPFPLGGPGGVGWGVLRREGLGPAAERAGFSLAQRSPALRPTARVWSPGSTAGTPSAPAASIMPARPARRCGPMVSRRQLRPERVGGPTGAQPELRAVGVWRAPRGCACVGRVRAWPLGRQAPAAPWQSPGGCGRWLPVVWTQMGSWHPRGCSESCPLFAGFRCSSRAFLRAGWGSPGGCPGAVWPSPPCTLYVCVGTRLPLLALSGGQPFPGSSSSNSLGPVYLLGGAWCSLRALVR